MTYGLDNSAAQRKYPVVPRPLSDSNAVRFPMFGTWIAALRKQQGLEQSQLAESAGISTDQISRLERGENVGSWYVAAVLATLNERRRLSEEHGLITSLVRDGSDIRKSDVLRERLNRKARVDFDAEAKRIERAARRQQK